VAVVYADWQLANAPPPQEILSAAIEHTCSALLVDTFDKSRGPLTAHLSWEELEQLVLAALAANLMTVLAGSLTLALARELLRLSPNFLAVRGAVCRGGRSGMLDASLTREFANLLLSTRDGGKQFRAPGKTIFAA